MIDGLIVKRAMVVVFITSLFTGAEITYAFEFCNIMKPSNARSDYGARDDYYGGPGIDAGYGYGGRGYGYRSPAYGYGGSPTPAHGYAAPAYGVPQPASDALQAETYELKQRIRHLEKALTRESAQRRSAPPDPGTG